MIDEHEAYQRWLAAEEEVEQLLKQFLPGSGFGHPAAESGARTSLESAHRLAERSRATYNEAVRRGSEVTMLKLQKSQHLATWASFVVAFVVGATTVLQTIITLLKPSTG